MNTTRMIDYVFMSIQIVLRLIFFLFEIIFVRPCTSIGFIHIECIGDKNTTIYNKLIIIMKYKRNELYEI